MSFGNVNDLRIFNVTKLITVNIDRKRSELPCRRLVESSNRSSE